MIDYYEWMAEPTFTLRDNASDMTKILPPDAVLSGPFAPQFTLSNQMGALIHMFGVAQVDSTLFERFPVTHLLVDIANENRARDDYPQIMGGAVRLVTYHVGKKKVRLYRIAERTNNIQTAQYQRSSFELAVDYYNTSEKVKSGQMLSEFLRLHPNNISGNLMLSELAEKAGQYKEAEFLLKKAVEFSPTNYNLNVPSCFYLVHFLDCI